MKTSCLKSAGDGDVPEAMIFVTTQKNIYEKAYGSEIWDIDLSNGTFETYVRESLQNFLAQMKCMVLMAADRGIELTEEENASAKEAADALLRQAVRSGYRIYEADAWDSQICI